MALPRPSSPRALLADLRSFTGQRSRVQWAAAAVAVIMPIAIIATFLKDSRTNIAPPPTVIYVENWRADRTDAEIVAQQKKDQATKEAIRKERQRQFQKLDKDLERIGL